MVTAANGCRRRFRRRLHQPGTGARFAEPEGNETSRPDRDVVEVVGTTLGFQPGESIPRHIHCGEEAFYVLQGATVETPPGKRIELATETGRGNKRDVPHAEFKVVGDKPVKLLTVHIVDKGAQVYRRSANLRSSNNAEDPGITPARRRRYAFKPAATLSHPGGRPAAADAAASHC